jgi:hypothetical protein
LLYFFFVVGTAMIFDDDGLVGTSQFITCPAFLFTLLFQVLMLSLRNSVVQYLSKQGISRYAHLLNWYSSIEERLSFEEFEDPE